MWTAVWPSRRTRMPDADQEARRRIRRTTMLLIAVALVFYLGFILLGVIRS